MALQPRNLTAIQYRNFLLTELENDEGLSNSAYIDTTGNATIGIGFNIEGNQQIREDILREFGFSTFLDSPAALTAAEFARETFFVQQITTAIRTAQDTATLTQQLNQTMSDRASQVENVNYTSGLVDRSRTSFEFTDDAEQRLFFENSVYAVFESDLEAIIPRSVLGYSTERTVLYSLLYNNVLARSPTLINAINTGDRAAAWMEIRYFSNRQRTDAVNANGIQNRRNRESDRFGLFNTGTTTPTNDEEAIDTLSFLYSRTQSIINNSFIVSGASTFYADDFFAEVDTALQQIESAYGQGREIHRVFRGLEATGIKSSVNVQHGTFSGTVLENDLLFLESNNAVSQTGSGDDVVYGDIGGNAETILLGDGDDYTNAGGGDDIIDGGAGDDVIYAGDGNDYIYVNSSGVNAVFGGAGDDFITAGALGTYAGEDGNDTYFWTGESNALISDFSGANELVLVNNFRVTAIKETTEVDIFDVIVQQTNGNVVNLGDYQASFSGLDLQIVFDGQTATIEGWNSFGIDVLTIDDPIENDGGSGNGSSGGGSGTGQSGGSRSSSGTLADRMNSQKSPHTPFMDGALALFNEARSIEYNSPLVLDLDGDGLELSSLVSSTTSFDFNGDDFSTLSGWVNSDDGILTLDINGDGVINNGSELFGTDTLLPSGALASNGFDALAQHDTNGDSIISDGDAVFSDLRVWRDLNQDGISNYGELFDLSTLNIASVDLAYSNVSQTNAGNQILQASSFTTISGDTFEVADVYFATSNLYTNYRGDFTLNDSVLSLPSLRGYGSVSDLYISMSQDSTLESLVAQLDGFDVSQERLSPHVEQILYRWAGVESVSTESITEHLDYRKLAVIEQFLGQAWDGQINQTTKVMLEDVWSTIFNSAYSRLLVQSAPGTALPGVGFNFYDDSIAFSSDLDAFVSSIANNEVNYQQGDTSLYWSNFSPLLSAYVTLNSVSTDAMIDKVEEITGNEELAVMLRQQNTIFGSFSNDTIHDFTGNDFIKSFEGDDLITTTEGNDIIDSGAGNDTLIVGLSSSITANLGDGNDVAEVPLPSEIPTHLRANAASVNEWTGGLGNDSFSVSSGADSFYFDRGDGHDTIRDYNRYTSENNNIDRIFFGADISSTDVSVQGSLAGDLILSIFNPNDPGNPDQITIERMYGSYSDRYAIEEVNFADGTTLSASDLMSLATNIEGTNSSDTLTTTQHFSETLNAYDGDDVIDVVGGGDIVSAGDGDDIVSISTYYDNYQRTIDLGDGNDTLSMTQYSAGNNIIAAGVGDDVLSLSLRGSNIADLGDGNDTVELIQPNTRSSTLRLNQLQSNEWIGGLGNDVFSTNSGTDTYYFNRGDGDDRIKDYNYYTSNNNNVDRIVFGAGINQSDITVQGTSTFDLVLTIANPSDPSSPDQITIENMYGFYSDHYSIEDVDFADGSTLSAADLFSLAGNLEGTSGNDTITTSHYFTQTVTTYEGDDTIDVKRDQVVDAGDGNDTVVISSYRDTFVRTIDLGDGNDTVSMSSTSAGTNNIAAGEGDDSLTVSLESNNVANLGDGNDSVSLMLPNTSPTTLRANQNQVNEWTGASGNDVFNTSSGTDIYHFNRGDGHDRIKDDNYYNSDNNNVDQIVFGAGIVQADISVQGTSISDLLISIANPGDPSNPDQIVIEGMYGADAGRYSIEELHFSDGSSLSATDLFNLAGNIEGTSGNDTIATSNYFTQTVATYEGDDTIDVKRDQSVNAGDGNDTVTISSYRDTFLRTIDLGEGNDTVLMNSTSDGTNVINAGAGDDALSVSLGSDNTVDLGSGNDSINLMLPNTSPTTLNANQAQSNDWTGGQGDDVFTTSSGEDTFHFSEGDGHDRINDYNHYNSTNQNVDSVMFEGATNPYDLWFTQQNSDLVIDLVGSNDQVIIEDWYVSDKYEVEEFHSNDLVLNHTAVDQLVNAMASFDVPDGVGAVVPQEVQDEINPVIASVWQ